MSNNNSAEIYSKIEEETRTFLKGENLRIALDLLAYIKTSGRSWVLSEHHPEFYFMGELSCLIAYMKFPLSEDMLVNMRRMIEEAGNRFVYDPTSSWNLCFWQNDNDLYEPDGFPIDEDVKEFARANVWKCIRCGGCGKPGGIRRTVFNKVYDNACCNVFQLANPDDKMLEYIKKLMELQKCIIAYAMKENNHT
jgi:hypothetical protein